MILDGRPIAQSIYQKLMPQIKKLRQKNIVPHLAVILIGQQADSELFVHLKEKKARELGLEFSLYHFPETITENKILSTIKYLNHDPTIHGLIVQLPLPTRFKTEKILNAVAAQKDVDGLGRRSPYAPPAPNAILELLKTYKISLRGRRSIIIGQGRLIGKPLLKILISKKLKVTSLGLESSDLIKKIQAADIIIAATGAPGIITEELVNKKSIVIDCAHDVKFEAVKHKVAAITPQVGGIGPITIANLLVNTVKAAQNIKIENKD